MNGWRNVTRADPCPICGHSSWCSVSDDGVMAMCRRLEPYDLAWIEEPVLPDDVEGYARIRRQTVIPVAGGEHEFSRWGFARLFEAGALAKGLTTSRVCTLLIDFEHSELKRPLSEFNGTRPTKEDMFKLVETINSALAEKALPRETLDVVFDKFWSDFKDKVDSALASSAGSASSRAPRRSAEDKVEEILETVRSIHMHLQARGPNRVGSAILDDYAGSGTAGTTNPRLKPFNYLERPGIR